jgi:hypothetical protein
VVVTEVAIEVVMVAEDAVEIAEAEAVTEVADATNHSLAIEIKKGSLKREPF